MRPRPLRWRIAHDRTTIAQKAPYPVDVKAGEGLLVRLRPQRQAAVLRRIPRGHRLHADALPAEKDGTLYFCGCKHTGAAPLCDGTHNSL